MGCYCCWTTNSNWQVSAQNTYGGVWRLDYGRLEVLELLVERRHRIYSFAALFAYLNGINTTKTNYLLCLKYVALYKGNKLYCNSLLLRI